MRALGRALAVSAAIWLLLESAASFDGVLEPEAEQQRHLDVHSILDPVGVVGHIGETLGQAGRVLGLRVADAVADLVSSAFGHGPALGYAPGHGHGVPVRPSWTRGDPGTLPASMQPAYQYGHGLGHGPVPRQPAGPTAVQAPPPSVLGGILRLLGLDSSKLGAIALNGVIFLAQLISSSLTGRPAAPPGHPGRSQAREKAADSPGPQPAAGDAGASGDDAVDADDDEEAELPAGTPLSWILDNPALTGSAALHQAQDPDLSERLIEEIQRRFPRRRRGPGEPGGPGGRRRRASGADDGEPVGPGGVGGGGGGGGGGTDTSCIQLLVCRAGPFLRGMQRSLRPVLKPPRGPAAGPAPSDPKGDTGDPRDGGQSGAGHQTAEEVDEARRWRRLAPAQRMFAHMPTTAEVLDQSATCARRFPDCKVSY